MSSISDCLLDPTRWPTNSIAYTKINPLNRKFYGSPTDAVIPDVVWISRERLNNGIDDAGHLIVAPELVVKILSPGELNEQRDKEAKRKLYSLHGVQEYWIVSWQREITKWLSHITLAARV